MADPRKKSRKKLIVFGILGLILLVVVLLVISQGGKEEIISVQTEKVTLRTVTEKVTATGVIESEFKVVITPEVTGEIVDLPVKDGDKVRTGQMLVRIKQDSYLAQQQRVNANLQSVQATLAMRDAELKKAESDYNRTKELNAKKLVSDVELEAVLSQYQTAKAMYDAAQANILEMRAQLRETNEQLYKTTISSPMDGTITALNVEKGERVLGSGFSQGTNMMTVSDLGNMLAIVDVDENDIVRIAVGDTARVKVDAYRDKIFVGIVQQIGNSAITTGTGTQEQVVNFEVKIKILDIDNNLRPGMSCNAEIETETKKSVVTVPIQSVTARIDEKPQEESELTVKTEAPNTGKNEIQEIVFVIENNKSVLKNVKTGISDNNFIEVIEGLKEGDEVVSGSFKAISRELKDGSMVLIENNKKDRFK